VRIDLVQVQIVLQKEQVHACVCSETGCVFSSQLGSVPAFLSATAVTQTADANSKKQSSEMASLTRVTLRLDISKWFQSSGSRHVGV
jgi:hypothetical protein